MNYAEPITRRLRRIQGEASPFGIVRLSALSAKLHGHDPWAYLKDVLERLMEHPNHRIDELLPHRWGPSA